MNGVDQIVDGRHAFFFNDIGNMGITGGRVGICMAKKCLDMSKT